MLGPFATASRRRIAIHQVSHAASHVACASMSTTTTTTTTSTTTTVHVPTLDFSYRFFAVSIHGDSNLTHQMQPPVYLCTFLCMQCSYVFSVLLCTQWTTTTTVIIKSKSTDLSISDGKDPERFAWPRWTQHRPEKCQNRIDNGQQAAGDHGVQYHCKVAQHFRVWEQDIKCCFDNSQRKRHLALKLRLLLVSIRIHLIGMTTIKPASAASIQWLTQWIVIQPNCSSNHGLCTA